MRRGNPPPLPGPNKGDSHYWQTIKALFPYVWDFRGRVLLALLCLVMAKVANVGVPLVFKQVIDAMSVKDVVLVLPVALLAAYGVLRFSSSLFTEFREMLFARVQQRVVRKVSLRVFSHLHALSLRFHLERQTGGLTRDIERGTRSIGSLISWTLYSILPTLVEIGLVLGVLLAKYEPAFAIITVVTLSLYIGFTVWVTNWRTALRRQANELDSAANSRAIDSLLNYETVKYFNNEGFEASRYNTQLQAWEAAATKSQISLSFLNLGQAAIISTGVTAMMWHAAAGVTAGRLTIGDLVLVNAFLIQLYMPLNFLGVLYREIRQALTDIERMFGLMIEHREIADLPGALALANADTASDVPVPCDVRFDHVDFSYDGKRPILQDVSFSIPAGATVAVVGHSGSGKSTLARLLFRFYDVQGGAVRVNGHDIRQLQQASLRQAIAIVPQDTVLFNDSIYYNIQYGRPDATRDEVIAAAQAAHIRGFVESLPDGWETKVGERGLKLSGGEKQRVAIARALLKNPSILVFDEATSALDSRTEKAIQGELELAAQGRTALVIAHRLSTVMNADEILVLERGRVIERGNHHTLLAKAGAYAQMWALQQQEEEVADGV